MLSQSITLSVGSETSHRHHCPVQHHKDETWKAPDHHMNASGTFSPRPKTTRLTKMPKLRRMNPREPTERRFPTPWQESMVRHAHPLSIAHHTQASHRSFPASVQGRIYKRCQKMGQCTACKDIAFRAAVECTQSSYRIHIAEPPTQPEHLLEIPKTSLVNHILSTFR